MAGVQKLSKKERQAVLRDVKKTLDPVERRHGEESVRWATNKIAEDRRERRRLERKRQELEEELAALGKPGS